MIIFIYLCLLLFCILFVYYPSVQGNTDFDGIFSENETGIKDTLNLNIDDTITSIKISLKDIHLEHQIGKISGADFQILREELLKEWSHYEKMKKTL